MYVVVAVMAIGLGLYYSIFLLYHARFDFKNLYLSGIVLVPTFNLYHDMMVHSRLLIQFPLVWGFGGAINPFIFPLTYLFYRQVRHEGQGVVQLLHFILPLIYLGNRFFHRLSNPYAIEELIRYYQSPQRPAISINADLLFFILVDLFLPLVYLLLIGRLLWMKDVVRQKWHRAIVAFPILDLAFAVLGYSLLFGIVSFDHWSLALTFSIVQVVLLGLLIMRFPVQTAGGLRTGLRYQSSQLSADEAGRILSRIDELVRSELLFKQADFSLAELSRRTGINQSYLSQSINSQLNLNFTDYINGFRVSLAKELLQQPAYNKYTVEAVAFEVGFNSKSSYYRAFRKHSGVTPAEFKRQHLKSGAN